jgi:hypothetical protein
MQQIDPPDAQADQLPPTQPTVGGHQDQRPIPGTDGLGESGDLGHGGEPHLRCPLLAGPLDRAGVAEQIAGFHSRTQDARQQPVGLGTRAGAHALCFEARQPGANGERVNAAQGRLLEGREQQPAQQVRVEVAGGRPQVDRRLQPAVGPLGQGDAAELGIGPGAPVQVDLDHRQVAGGVGLAGDEGVRPGVHDAGQVAVADLPATPTTAAGPSRTPDAPACSSAGLPPEGVDAASSDEGV